MTEHYVTINDCEIKLTNLEKLMWPEGLTKAHLIKYYWEMAPYILPHLANRPLVMKRYPDGINGEAFYHKDCPDYAPDWIQIRSVEHSAKVVNYIVCNNLQTLIWLVNYGCLEMHPWLSPVNNLDRPDFGVLDLDPNPPAGFAEARQAAIVVSELLKRFQLRGYPKTSGKSGIHIYLNLGGRYSYQEVRQAFRYLAELVVQFNPKKYTVEREVASRGARVYIDYLQNGLGKTIASVYSLRPVPGAPVSAPVTWEELEDSRLAPSRFHIANMGDRIREKGDLFAAVLTDVQSLDTLLKAAD